MIFAGIQLSRLITLSLLRLYVNYTGFVGYLCYLKYLNKLSKVMTVHGSIVFQTEALKDIALIYSEFYKIFRTAYRLREFLAYLGMRQEFLDRFLFVIV